MNNNQLTEIAKILGVSEDSITALDDEIRNSMTAVLETTKDKKAVYDTLDDLWQKGSVYVELHEVSKATGILYATLKHLDWTIVNKVDRKIKKAIQIGQEPKGY